MTHQHVRGGFPIGRGGKVLLAAWSLFLLAGFAVAASLSPDPRGYGTHQQFGLPPCTIRMLTGIPCPSCGATTSFAHFVRGEWVAAMRANGAALILAVVCAVQIPWSWISIARGRLCGIAHPERFLIFSTLILGGVFFLQWLAWVVV